MIPFIFNLFNLSFTSFPKCTGMYLVEHITLYLTSEQLTRVRKPLICGNTSMFTLKPNKLPLIISFLPLNPKAYRLSITINVCDSLLLLSLNITQIDSTTFRSEPSNVINLLWPDLIGIPNCQANHDGTYQISCPNIYFHIYASVIYETLAKTHVHSTLIVQQQIVNRSIRRLFLDCQNLANCSNLLHLLQFFPYTGHT